MLDRTFIDNKGVRWIIDYKVGIDTHDNVAAYLQQQKHSTKDSWRVMLDFSHNKRARPVRLGLYFPLLSQWCEWEHAAALSV